MPTSTSKRQRSASGKPEAVCLHRQDNRHGGCTIGLRLKCPSEGPGFLLQLSIRCCYLDWIAGRQVWAARFGMQIVHEASTIQLIDWFDSFPQTSVDVRTGPTEVVTRQVPFAGVVRWDVLDPVITAEGVATPPRRPGR